MRGYYSLIQFCPDQSRAEVANVGVLLFCPEARFLDVRMANGNDRPRRIFKTTGEALRHLDQAKEMMTRRIHNEAERIRTVEQLSHFIDTRANQLILTPPRNMRVENPEEDILNLLEELVSDRAGGEVTICESNAQSEGMNTA